MGAIVYRELHLTPATFIADVKAAILESTDWAVMPTQYDLVGTLTGAMNIGGNTVNTTNADESTMSYAIGSTAVLNRGGANAEIVTITATATTNLTTSAVTQSHAIGETFEIINDDTVRAITSAGTVLALSLFGVNGVRCGAQIFRTHNGTTGADSLSHFLRWVNTNQTSLTIPVHVDLVVGPDFLWISIEGPRSGEPALESLGPYRMSFFLGTLVPYDDADTSEPLVAVVNANENASMGPQVYVSRNADNNASWVVARLATVIPHMTTAATPSLMPAANIKHVVGTTRFFWPWIVSEDIAGPRGRLKRVFFGGMDGYQNSIAGQKYNYDGLTYLSIPALKATANRYDPWGGYAGSSDPRVLALVPVAGTPT